MTKLAAQAMTMGGAGGPEQWHLGPQLAVLPSWAGPKGGASHEQHSSTGLKGKETVFPILFGGAELFKN